MRTHLSVCHLPLLIMFGLATALALPATAGQDANAGGGAATAEPEFPPFEAVSKGLEKLVSTADGQSSLYTLYVNRKDGRLIAELPRDFDKTLLMIAPTVAGGAEDAGVMGSTLYARWQRFDRNLVLIEPNFLTRSSGDDQSKRSVRDLYTDHVILDLPILAIGPGGGPVIDLKAMMVGQYLKFFGPSPFGIGADIRGSDPRLATLQKAKAFPQNIEVAYQLPGPGGRLVSMHYSILALPEDPTYKPRKADSRVGYFNVYYDELGKPGNDEPVTRYIMRWKIEKADPSLRRSPPRRPLVWYIEDTTPVRYRQYVREGILSWNKAFEACGIINALEVYQQDSATGAHMDKDPEDARYNFFRWNTTRQGYAIGPSRGDPRTGQLIDADVVWHAGLTDAIIGMLRNLSGEIATANMTDETLAWLAARPQWDPRVRLAPAAQRDRLLNNRNAALVVSQSGALDAHQHAMPTGVGRSSAMASNASCANQCQIGQYLSMNFALAASAFDAGLIQPADPAATLDGLPEEFIGPMIRYVSAHEVGHCLGLQHNFSASTIRSLDQINSGDYDGPTVGSVMEYAGVNIRAGEPDGRQQGAYATPCLGPYDIWAIQYGYGPDDELPAVLARVNEPDLLFHNDMSMASADPRVMTWDMGADSLAFCESRMRLVHDLRSRIVSDIVKDGQSWRRARDRYNALLNTHAQAIMIASRWVGASYMNRNFKGDPDGKPFIEDVPADRQRMGLQFVISNSFRDDAFGLTPDLVQSLGLQFWPDQPGAKAIDGDPSYEIHDTVSGLQATGLTLIMNPTTLRRVYDNEFRTASAGENPITLAEVMATVTGAAWSELDAQPAGSYSAARPMISSFRRNLQREHLERLVDLMLVGDAANPAMRTISTLCAQTLRDLNTRIGDTLNAGGAAKLDPYTLAHLNDVRDRIEMALAAQYVIPR